MYDIIWYDMVCAFRFRHDFDELWICWWWYALSMFTFIQGVFLQGSFVHEIRVQPCALEKRIQPQLPYENILTRLWCIPVVLLMQLRQITGTITVSPIVFCPRPLEYMYHESTSHSHDSHAKTARWENCIWTSTKKTTSIHELDILVCFIFFPINYWPFLGSGWWFWIFFMFTFTWGNDPIWLIFFNWVKTTT